MARLLLLLPFIIDLLLSWIGWFGVEELIRAPFRVSSPRPRPGRTGLLPRARGAKERRVPLRPRRRCRVPPRRADVPRRPGAPRFAPGRDSRSRSGDPCKRTRRRRYSADAVRDSLVDR